MRWKVQWFVRSKILSDFFEALLHPDLPLLEEKDIDLLRDQEGNEDLNYFLNNEHNPDKNTRFAVVGSVFKMFPYWFDSNWETFYSALVDACFLTPEGYMFNKDNGIYNKGVIPDYWQNHEFGIIHFMMMKTHPMFEEQRVLVLPECIHSHKTKSLRKQKKHSEFSSLNKTTTPKNVDLTQESFVNPQTGLARTPGGDPVANSDVNQK